MTQHTLPPAAPRDPAWLTPQRFAMLKYGVYLLLAGNVAAMLLWRSAAEMLDSLGWLLLVAVMEYETRIPRRWRHRWLPTYFALLLRLLGYGLVLQAWALFRHQSMWLDLANATLWLLVCAALEYDVHLHEHLSRREQAFRHAIKFTLYGLLAGCAALWGLRGDWLGFYDALLWLLAFFAIELNVFGITHPAATEPPRPRH